MTDREIFRKNLNDFLSSSGKLQKDLAEYVGAKTTTVSGWTRGVSYPRADAMEKIAMFFGVPTSRLVGDSSAESSDESISNGRPISHPEIRLLASRLDRLPKEQRDQALDVFNAMYHKFFDNLEDEKK